jgi:3',5'-cyclic AMP phosphodiesterase CpdA
VLIAQITDTHVTRPGELAYGAVDTGAYLAQAVAAIAGLSPRPDLCLLTGDLVDLGLPEEYDHLRALLAPLPMPLVAIPGNHDAREPMRAAFGRDGYLPRDGFLQFTVEDWPLRLVGLDTLVPGQHRGELCRDRLGWLERTLAAAPDRPTLLMMHHPPFATGIGFMDRMGLTADGFADIVAGHPRIERIVCGHLHRPIDCRFAGTIAGTAPSTAHQTVLNLGPEAADRFALEPPGYQLHRWNEATGLVTHTAAIGEWPQLRSAGKGRLAIG